MTTSGEAIQQIAAIRAILDLITDPVTPEATDEDLRDAMRGIIGIAFPERALYAPKVRGKR